MPERARLAWLRALDVHLRAARTAESAADLHAGLGKRALSEAESRRATTERAAYREAVARHPEWVPDVAQPGER